LASVIVDHYLEMHLPLRQLVIISRRHYTHMLARTT